MHQKQICKQCDKMYACKSQQAITRLKGNANAVLLTIYWSFDEKKGQDQPK